MSSLTSARLLRLLSLFQARRDWTGAELAERLEVTPRTVRRDVQRLRDLGYPVDATPGVAGGYRLGVGSTLPPLLLDDEETVAVAVGLRAAASGGSLAGIEETSVRALAKLEQLLPSRLRRRVSALHTFTDTVGRKSPTVDSEHLTVIAGCCRDAERLHFRYRDHHGQETRRVVEPNKMVHAAGRWYLLAWDVDRDDWRVFRLDRMEGPLSTGPRFDPRTPPEDAADYVARGISSSAYRHTARVLVHASEEDAAQRLSPMDGTLTRVDDRTCELRIGGNALDMLAVYLLFFGFDFSVLEPAELEGELKALRDRIDRSLGGARPGPGSGSAG
ncbi:helix-turn-helix transcriptional regulator [Nocardiopsis composta]|uniref:Putative DNA-binding transcriptional regulator YafY n=1 Tax=Nocardiopsis composta TaxID=157465 RepID=A0A7W8QNM3_9ACTN|nr:YafY family protein [Nocardiopsis composta]MBB5433636.1 putative DNA-binding transcriptional regulator YafY [Nocardiopsis composta]